MFGPPDENEIVNHPLAKNGIHAHDVFQVVESSWIRGLLTAAAESDAGLAARFAHCNHYIFAFHDSTFECIAESFVANIEQIDQLGGEYAVALLALRQK